MRCTVLLLLSGCAGVFDLEQLPQPDMTDAPSVFDLARCPSDYVEVPPIATSRYSVRRSFFSYQEAKATCHSEITHLLTFDIEAQADLLTFVEANGGGTTFHIGLEQATPAVSLGDSWQWITGEPFVGSWGFGEPNDGADGIENAEEQLGAWQAPGGLIDQMGPEQRNFICECDGRATPP